MGVSVKAAQGKQLDRRVDSDCPPGRSWRKRPNPGESDMPYEDLASAFKSGDVIYGLDQPRNAAVQAVTNLGFRRQVTYRSMILGCIPGPEKTRAVVLIQNDITNAVWDPQKPNQYASRSAIGKVLMDAARGEQFRAFLQQHPRYNVAQNNRVTADPIKGPVEAWRRTSKGGLEFQVRYRGAKVHFVVEKIIDSLDQVASKQHHGQSITSAELRWLYRHRHLADVQNNVRFWLPDGEVSQDDLFSRKEWSAYAPKHTYQGDWEQQGIDQVLHQVKNL